MRTIATGIKSFVDRHIFVKYILATMLIGITVNAIVLLYFYEKRKAEQTGQVAAEMATVAARIGRPALALVNEGNDARARELLSVLAAYPYAICADLMLEGNDKPLSSWPVIGCQRIKKQGDNIAVALAGSGSTPATLQVRIDPGVLATTLRLEFLRIVALGFLGGLALILAGALAFLWSITRPLSQLLRSIKRFEQHDDPQKVAYSARDEIGQVVGSYNSMLDREVERVSQIRDAHKATLESINYATRIQRGLLPANDQIKKILGDAAILWQPRDLVSGDVYWVHADGQRTTIAMIDCTGHGVPGGFMSMLAIATLERLFAEQRTLSPGAILAQLSDLTRELLKQNTSDADSNDGMDAAVCQFDAKTDTGLFAGARLSLIHCDEGLVQRIPGDRMSIGYADTPANPQFSEQPFAIGPDTKVFLSTDGIIDQLGGPKKIAFGYRGLMNVIKANTSQSPEYILDALQQSLADYMGSETRRDDVAVIAFKPHHTSLAE